MVVIGPGRHCSGAGQCRERNYRASMNVCNSQVFGTPGLQGSWRSVALFPSCFRAWESLLAVIARDLETNVYMGESTIESEDTNNTDLKARGNLFTTRLGDEHI